MTSVYILCATVGVTFVVLTLVMGWVGAHGDAGGADHGTGPDVGHEFGDGGHGDASGIDSTHGGFDLPLFSPTALAALVTGFGGAGLIFQGVLGDRPALHAPLAAAGGVAFWVGMAWLSVRLLRAFEGPGVASAAEIYRQDLEVTVTIPPNGFGEVVFLANGIRHTMPARGEPGTTYAAGSRVRARKVIAGSVLVRGLDALEAPGVGKSS